MTSTSQELEEARQLIEKQQASLEEKEEKYNKLIKTVKAARARIDTLKSEKDQVRESEIFNLWPLSSNKCPPSSSFVRGKSLLAVQHLHPPTMGVFNLSFDLKPLGFLINVYSTFDLSSN